MSFVIALAFIFATQSAHAATLVDINVADVAALDTLPNIGPARAAAIISYRQSHGPFTRTDELMDVKGIGPAIFEGLKALVTVGEVAPSTPKVPSEVVSPKPSPVSPSSTKVQKVEPVIKNISETAHEMESVVAPAARTATVLAAGAALPQALVETSILHSPWLYGFIGVVLFSAAALILL